MKSLILNVSVRNLLIAFYILAVLTIASVSRAELKPLPVPDLPSTVKF